MILIPAGRFNPQLAQAHHGPLADVQPGGGGQQRPEGAGTGGERQAAGDAVELQLPLLPAGIPGQVEAVSLPGPLRGPPGERVQPFGERLPGGAVLGRQEGRHPARGGDRDIGECRLFDQAALAPQPQRRVEPQPAGRRSARLARRPARSARRPFRPPWPAASRRSHCRSWNRLRSPQPHPLAINQACLSVSSAGLHRRSDPPIAGANWDRAGRRMYCGVSV